MTGQAKSAGSATSPVEAPGSRAKREPVLRADGMSFRGKRSFDLDLLEGEVIGVTGLDGAGQDDFVRALACIRPSDKGTVKMKVGSAWNELRDPLGAENAGLAFVSGDRKREGIFPNLSIFENLAIGLYKQTSNKAGFIARTKLERIFADEVRRLSIKIGNEHDRITTLSGGNQQKVLISRALAAKPRVIVLNDPARGVDIGTKKDLYRELKKFVANGGAVVYLSSELEEFFDFADRVAVFYDRSIFRVLEGAEICEEKILPAMFGHIGRVHFDGPVEEVYQ
jgi:ribose transport system ATP-binding protein